jgi:hypothetical protein
MKWESPVSIVTLLQAAGWAVGSVPISSPEHPGWLWGPANLLSNGYWEAFFGVKQLDHEADHSSPSSAEIENVCSYASTP